MLVPPFIVTPFNPLIPNASTDNHSSLSVLHVLATICSRTQASSGMVGSFVFSLFVATLNERSLAGQDIRKPSEPRKVDSVFP